MKNRGKFIISLDFELHWGAIEKWDVEKTREKFSRTRLAIDKLLALFGEHEIHVTWATVGFLFAQNREELMDALPASRPRYANRNISTYRLVDEGLLGENEQDDQSHFAASIVNKINKSKYQEVSSHTFSHYYTLEPGQDIETFTDDIASARNIAARRGVELKSLVFPRNQFNLEYLNVLSDLGFTSVRSNPRNWIWNNSFSKSAIVRKLMTIFRGVDAILPISGTLFPSKLEKTERGMYLLPASRFLRPYSASESSFTFLKLNRIKREMYQAAKTGKCFHLWWHPHNFSQFTEENLQCLEDIILYFEKLKDKYGFESLNMSELVDTQTF